MKALIKIGVSFALALAVVISLATLTSEPASAVAPCPPNHCPEALDGYTYVGTCASGAPGQTCLGWVYRGGGETCHVAALGG